jgi:hypothetical protein
MKVIEHDYEHEHEREHEHEHENVMTYDCANLARLDETSGRKHV